jgi:hypothetical protein
VSLPVGCTLGYRHPTGADSRLGDLVYGAFHTDLPVSEDGFRPVAEGRTGFQNRGTSPSATIPNGVDQWFGLAFEAEGGGQLRLLHSEKDTVWAEAAIQAGVLRDIQHLAGPSGHHDHMTDPHQIHVLGEIGSMLRLGYSRQLTDQGSALGLELGVGFMQVAARGLEPLVEIRLLSIRW